MAGENATLVRRIYDAFGRRDVATLADLVAPDVVVTRTPLLPWGGEYAGHAGVLEFFGKLAGSIDSQVETSELFEAGDRVVQVGRTRGRAAGRNRDFDVAEVHVWTVRDGKATQAEFYVDTPAMLAALEGDAAR